MSTAGLWTSRMAMFSCCTSFSSYCVPVWHAFLILMKSMPYCVVIAMEAYMSSISISTQKSRIQNNWIGNVFMRWTIHNSNRFFPHSLLDNLIMYWEKSIIMILLPPYFIGMNACILVVMMVESICTPLTSTHPPSKRRSTIRSKLWNKSLDCLWRGITPLLFVDSWIMNLFYDLSMNSILHRILCGGWKRPWDLYSSPSSLSYLFLCASTYGHQAIQIHSYAQQQNEENRSLSPLIVPSFHSQEIYACKWIAAINSDYSLIVTGGEDRTLKLGLVQYHEHQPVSVHIVDTLEGHFTLVKSIAVQQYCSL